MPQIVPIKDLRDTTKVSDLCHETDEPIFVTKNGYGDMVVLSVECYDKMFSRVRMFDEIMKGVKQADEGKMLDGDTAMASLKAKYGTI